MYRFIVDPANRLMTVDDFRDHLLADTEIVGHRVTDGR
jgi:hypothetical protein